MTLTFDGVEFSDGSSLDYTVGRKPEITPRHSSAIFSNRSIVLRLGTCGSLPEVEVVIEPPVSVGKILGTMMRYYGTRITSAEYEYMRQRGELREWNRGIVKDWTAFERQVRTRGDLRGDYNAFGGLYKTGMFSFFSNKYEPHFDS